MFRIKRTKTPIRTDGKPGAEAVHYAKTVSPRGVVEAWSSDAAQAAVVSAAVTRMLREQYEGKKNSGSFAFEVVAATPGQLAEAVVDKDAIGAEEFAKLQQECRDLREENEKLKAAATEGMKELREALEMAQEEASKVRNLESQLSEASKRNAELAAQVADLEAQLSEQGKKNEKNDKQKKDK